MLKFDFFKSITTWVAIILSGFLIYACSYGSSAPVTHKKNKPVIQSIYILKDAAFPADIKLSPYGEQSVKILKNSDIFYVTKHYGPWAYGCDEKGIYGFVLKTKLILKENK